MQTHTGKGKKLSGVNLYQDLFKYTHKCTYAPTPTQQTAFYVLPTNIDAVSFIQCSYLYVRFVQQPWSVC